MGSDPMLIAARDPPLQYFRLYFSPCVSPKTHLLPHICPQMVELLVDVAKTQSPESYVYTRLAAQHIGEIASVVISGLISFGRLPAREIARKCKLSSRSVQTALVSLIQLNCVSYWTEKGLSMVYYTLNPTGLKVLLHGGDIIVHIRDVYGDEEAEIVQNVIENGNVTVRNYMGLFADETTQFRRMELLVRLYADGWLRRLQPVDFQPIEDVWNRLFLETLANTPRSAAVSEVKRIAEVKLRAKVRLSELYALGNSNADVFSMDDGVKKLQPNITLAFNLGRYEKALRSRSYVELARSRVGILTAQIYKVCCSLVEQKSADLRHKFLQVSGLVATQDETRAFLEALESTLVENKLTVFTVHEVVRRLPDHLDLSNSITSRIFTKPGRVGGDSGAPSKKIKLENGSAFPLENGYGHEDIFLAPTPLKQVDAALVEEHLQLLANDAIPFLHKLRDGQYTIPFLQLSKAVKAYNYDAIVKTTMGVEAHRVFRCVKDQKLADDRTIAKLVLQKDGDVKSLLFDLIAGNFIQLQEIPRSADRAATKSVYLFRHEETASYQYMKELLMFNIGQVLSNIDLFKLDHKILLEKCERDDVKGHEEELLLESELKTLKELQTREVSNIGRMNRVKWLYVLYGEL